MANQALDGSEQNGDMYQEYYEALKKAREIIEQQNAKLQQRIGEVNKKRAKRSITDRKKLICEKKRLEDILKLLKDEDESVEPEDPIPNEGESVDEIRELLIDGLIGAEKSSPVRVKIMGNLESKPFYDAVKRHNNREDALHIALNKCAFWTELVRNPSWRPFKVVAVEEGESVEIVDDSDKRLKTLKTEMGEKVYNAVARALTEMNEYNPSARKPVPELWNFDEGRKATLKEGIASVLNRSEQSKRTRLLP